MNNDPQLQRARLHVREGWRRRRPRVRARLRGTCPAAPVLFRHSGEWASAALQGLRVHPIWRARIGAPVVVTLGLKGLATMVTGSEVCGAMWYFGSNNKLSLRGETGGWWEQTGETGAAGVQCSLGGLVVACEGLCGSCYGGKEVRTADFISSLSYFSMS